MRQLGTTCLKYAPDRVVVKESLVTKTAIKRKISNRPKIKNCETPEIIGFIFFKESFWLPLCDVLLSRCVINRTFENAIFIYLCSVLSKQTFTCSKSTFGRLGKDVKSVPS